MIKVLVSLSSHLLCEGIKKLVDESAVGVVWEGGAETSSNFEPDVVLFSSKKNIGELRDCYPDARFVLLDTGLNELDLTCLFLCHHISGIVPPEADQESLCKAIKVVHAGEVWIDQKHLKSLIEKGRSLPGGLGTKGLSVQDKKIVALISRGCKNHEIAAELCLSVPTIKSHVSKIYKMLKVRNRAQLACLAQDSDVKGL